MFFRAFKTIFISYLNFLIYFAGSVIRTLNNVDGVLRHNITSVYPTGSCPTKLVIMIDKEPEKLTDLQNIHEHILKRMNDNGKIHNTATYEMECVKYV